MSNVKRKLAMFLAVIIFTGGVHALASNSTSVKEDNSAIEQEMTQGKILITGNEKVRYDGAPVTFNNENGDFHYEGDGMPVWYQLNKDGKEKGGLDENYTRIRNYPKDAGKYAVTVYNDKIEEHSEPFYFEIEKAPLKLQWPEKVAKIYDGNPYFNLRLKYVSGLMGNDANNKDTEFRVRVTAEDESMGVRKVVDIERHGGYVDMKNYEFKDNAPSVVEIVPYSSMLPKNSDNPGGISKIVLPEDPANEKDNEKSIEKIFENIVKTVTADSTIDPSKDDMEKETFETEKNISKAVRRDAYINLYVTGEKANINEIMASTGEDEIYQAMDIEVYAKSVEQNRLVCELGHLKKLNEKLSFTINIDEKHTSDKLGVARVVDGQLEFLPEKDVKFNHEKNIVTFKTNYSGTFVLVPVR